MFKITKDETKELERKLRSLEQVKDNGWAVKCAELMETLYKEYMDTQGRASGTAPPLSSATKLIYNAVGEPDGSGVTDHIEVTYTEINGKTVATIGILDGKPSLIAKVQDQGAVVAVTDKMRGFLASCGIFLKDSTTQIVIPARHSWEYALTEAAAEAKDSLHKQVKRMLS